MERRKGAGQVIRGDAAEVTQWQPPHVHHRGESSAQDSHGPLTAGHLDSIQKAAHEEGFEQGRREGQEYGHREGLEEGRLEVRARIERLDCLIEALDRPFEQLDQQLENEIVTLVISMVRQLIRREVKLDPAQIVGVVREALAILPVGARSIRVVLHPEDAELVREAYAMGEHDQKWHIIGDPVIQRGGCRIHTDTSQIDATLDSRLNSLIAPLLAGERVRDAGEAEPHGT
ncbi:MAG: flagellar assembly protein FliH [Chromatiaceae bacterium]|nr:flagellar assembly protein FliH [Gammaproteobacteria bacterium]MCP5301166.1 flagellar assembly protein FliH [Chromatiaceae bacterium]MCP5421362.1 flagellar assembly protein FliH [Chromatiaceae bacterium]